MLSAEVECIIVPSQHGLRVWCDEDDQSVLELGFDAFTVLALQNKALPQDQLLYAVCQKTPSLATFLA